MPDLISLGLHTLAKTASPDEFASALKLVGVKDADMTEEEKEEAEKASKDKAAKDKAVKDAEEEKAKEEKAVKDALAEMEKEGGMADAEHEKDCDCEKCMAAKDEESIVIPLDERPGSEFGLTDALKHLDAMKPFIARSKDKGAIDAWKGLRRGVARAQKGVKDGLPDPFRALTRISNEEGFTDAEPEIPAFKFFSGKPHDEGLKAYNDYLASRQRRS